MVCLVMFCQGQVDDYCTAAADQLMCFKTTRDDTHKVSSSSFLFFVITCICYAFRAMPSQQAKVNLLEILQIQKLLAIEVLHSSRMHFTLKN